MVRFEELNRDPDLYIYDRGFYIKHPKKGELHYERDSYW